MSNAASRWKHALFLMSLDRAAHLWQDLWLQVEQPAQVRTALQRLLVPYLSDERFYHEAERIAVDALRGIQAHFGTDTVVILRDWCAHVLVNGGADRAQEDYWAAISVQLANGVGELSSPLYERCRLLHANVQRRRAVLKESFALLRRDPASDWDRQIVLFSHGDLQDADNYLAVTATLNAFAEAWSEECADLEPEELVALRDAVEPFRSELGMQDVEVGVPGIWAYELGDFLVRARGSRPSR